MRILGIFTCWNNNDHRRENNEYGGVGYYRIAKPLEWLKKEYGWEYDLYGSNFAELFDKEEKSREELLQQYIDIVKKYDVVISKLIDNTTALHFMIMACKEAGVPLLFDMDDNVRHVEEWQPAYEKGYQPGGKQRIVLLTGLSLSDGILCSTQSLKDAYRSFYGRMEVDIPMYILPNYNDIGDWKKSAPSPRNKFVIGWAGSATHNNDLRLAIPGIETFLSSHDDAYIELVGGVGESNVDYVLQDAQDKEFLLSRMIFKEGTLSWKDYPDYLMDLEWNVAIAPLVYSQFNRSKSNIKYLEYAMKKIPIIVSPVTPYMCVQHDKTGLIAHDTEWYQSLEKVYKTDGNWGENAYRDVVDNWQYKDNIYKWKDAIEDVISNYKNKPKT